MMVLDIFSKLTNVIPYRSGVRDDDDTVQEAFMKKAVMQQESVKDIEDILTVNTRITISVKKDGYQGVYDSRVEDIENGMIYIAQPTDDGLPVPMVPGTKTAVEFVNNSGRYRFETSVTGRTTQGSVSLVEIAAPKTFVKNQLREFYRVGTSIKAKVKLYYASVPDKNMKIPHKSFDCVVVDISGGGGKLITDAWIENKQEFSLDISEAIDFMDNAPCTAIRVKRILEKTEVSFKFDFKKENDRNQIVKYVFKRQIELKQFFG